MKKIVLLLSVVSFLTGCQTDTDRNYAVLSGKLTHQNSDSLMVASQSKIIKTIKVAKDGTFSDTLKVKNGAYNLSDGEQQTVVYLQNGYDLQIGLDGADFNQSIVFGGRGAQTNSYEKIKQSVAEKIFDAFASMLMFVYNLFK